MQMDTVIVGSVALDTIETPLGKHERALGGAATYASIAASYFAKPGVVGVVGGDFDRKHVNLLKRRGVDLEGLQVEKAGKTFHWSGFYEGDMNEAQTRATDLNVFETFNPVLPESYRDAPQALLGNILPALQLEVLSQLRDPRMVLCDTMNFWIASAPDELEKVFRKVDVICINDAEAKQFTNQPSVPSAAKELLKLGPGRVVIKKGSNGVALFGKREFFALPAIPLLTVKDPTGAGDSFAGGFVGRVARSRNLDDNAWRRALVAGTVMASYCVEDFNCQKTASLTKDRILSRAAQLREATRMPSFSL
jgi:sugar/nucleoside kinase (ribokinase family)